ncbi:MAG: MBL fold metallo-hydrolase [Enterobacteriaceae bacterium]
MGKINPDKAHHTPEGFCNLAPWQMEKEAIKRWQQERKANGYPKPPQSGYRAFVREWWQPADFHYQGNALWWLGHSTVLLQYDGLRILTDPVFSTRVSPVSFAGPRRRMPLPARLNALPDIDIVLISHNHYDHLDRASVCRLAKRFPAALFAVPLGLKKWLQRQGVKQAVELDWWQTQHYQQAKLISVPAQHWSMRTPWDRNRTLWGGWVVHLGEFRFYFAGDTAYASHLQEIGKRLGPFDLAALPIGAYAPRWFMKHSHIDPHQAVQLHRELGCQKSVAIHWATFELADEALDAPPLALAQALQEQQVSTEDFRLLKVGQRWELGK